MVLRGLTTIWSLATLPTSRSPLSLIATTLGRMSEPLSLGTTRATLLRTYATHVFVVPRSMPSRMGLSAGMKLTRCYGAPHPRRNKTPSANERHNAQLHQRASIPPPAASLPLPPFPTVRRRTAACRAAHGPGCALAVEPGEDRAAALRHPPASAAPTRCRRWPSKG